MQKRVNSGSVSLLKSLNSVQKKAVEYTTGPSLILAGAGSGKTKVLTHKVAYLIERKNVTSEKILALTFTNKAAREMQQRIYQLIKGPAHSLWCSTFHSSFARILRKNSERLGYQSNFAIFDENDQLSLIKNIINDLKIGHEKYTAKSVRFVISNMKNKLIMPAELKQNVRYPIEEYTAEIYPHYQQRLKKNNAMDFDDLLVNPIELFVDFPNVLQYYQHRWQYILVDEYQDTNYPQYVILKMLSATHRNISVVGDDDQSIYRWRGAEIRNILDFEKDFPESKVFRLEQNYRSTGNILAVANSIIRNNSRRMDKELWTKKDNGETVTLLINNTGEEEALKIVNKIQEEFHQYKRNFSDFAILYRTNAQSRVLEDGLRRNGIAYVIVGGIRFFERKEVKDILAYLRAVSNPLDEISIKRIINYPLRGIGDTTISKIEMYCAENNLPFIEGLRKIEEIITIAQSTRQKISDFYNFLFKYSNLQQEISAIELATTLVEELGILRAFKEEGTDEALSRRENVQELLTQISQFCHDREDASLALFLEDISLVADIDRWDDNTNAVTLMTLHAAKGLEFPVVFVAGLEEGLLPLSRNSGDEHELEEERRLFYVGATRAEQKLYLSRAVQRRRYGETFSGKCSRFLKEIDKDLIEVDDLPVYGVRYHHADQRQRSYGSKKRVYYREAPEKKSIRKGALVRHKRFGKGVVRSVEGDEENGKAIVLFEEVGEKKLVLKIAKLEIL